MQINKQEDGSVLVTAPVMIPGAKDCDYTRGEPPLTKEQIQEFAKSYEKYQFIDKEHELTRNGIKSGVPIESFILDRDTEFELLDGALKSYPAGTWMLTTKVTDNEAVRAAESGDFDGYSASIYPRERADQYLEALKSKGDCACKNFSTGSSLIKDVPNPVVLSVSLTKKPCLHDSKFCKLKDKVTTMTDENKSKLDEIKGILGIDTTEYATKSEMEAIQASINEIKTEFSEALKSMSEQFDATLKEALAPAFEAEKSEEEEKEEPEAEETEPSEEEKEEATEEKEEEEEEKKAEKGESKSGKIHDGGEAEKSATKSIYEFLGRNPNGTRKR